MTKILLIIALMSTSFASDCTYIIPQERVYYEGYFIEVGQRVDPIMQELGYTKSSDLSATFLIDTYFSTLPSRPLDKASLIFTVFDKNTVIHFESAQTINCYTQVCSQTAAYTILDKALNLLERRFPKCEKNEN